MLPEMETQGARASARAAESEKHVIGKCIFMCPLKETQLREREGLLHKFERLEDPSSAEHYKSFNGNQSTKFSNRSDIGKFARRTLPKADKRRTVKSFSRSAAGLDKTCPDDLRPPHVLLQTVHYLCTEILSRKDDSPTTVYDFVFDRLRSVRQDLVIQRISDLPAIRILEVIVNFHVYSAYRFQNEPLQTFDPHINTKHLIDCLKRLICLYELNEYWGRSRNEFEALHVIICPDSSDVLSRAFSLRHFINDPVFDIAIEMSLAYQFRNYVKYFRKAKELPPLLASYVVQHTTHMRSLAYQIMSFAYGNKTCKFPLSQLSKILCYQDTPETEFNLGQIEVEIVSDETGTKYARFAKTSSLKLDKINVELALPCRNVIDPDNIKFITTELICPWKDIT